MLVEGALLVPAVRQEVLGNVAVVVLLVPVVVYHVVGDGVDVLGIRVPEHPSGFSSGKPSAASSVRPSALVEGLASDQA